MEENLYSQFKKLVNANPDKLAVFDDNKRLTRYDLDNLVNTIAYEIPYDSRTIAVIMDHGCEQIAAILAVLKLGATFIPIEASFPEERIKFMLKESESTCIITNSKYDKLTPEKLHKIHIDAGYKIKYELPDNYKQVNGDNLAYILYTSGSTGKAKGVSVTNNNVLSYVESFRDEFKPTKDDVMLQYSVCTFDIFIEEVFTTLLSDATLAIISSEHKKNINTLMQYVKDNNITIISSFPYLLQEINELESVPESLRLLISGGDVLRSKYVDNLVDKIEVYNTYGPSETTVCTSYYNCSRGYALNDGTYPIGKAIKSNQITILDENNQRVTKGQVGEICICGQGVSNGYIGNRTEENRAFVTLDNGMRMYKSGDLGYLLDDGNIAFVKRKDSQVMIMGKRVEINEVQSILMKHEKIKQAIVTSNKDSNNLNYMTAYIISDNIDIHELKDFLKQYLTDYMIPEYFLLLDKLPFNANGKVDMKKLPIILKE